MGITIQYDIFPVSFPTSTTSATFTSPSLLTSAISMSNYLNSSSAVIHKNNILMIINTIYK